MRARAPLEVQDPILIVGPWRSGSTVMHELLASATQLAAPQTWQCMNAASFVVTGAPRARRAVQRPMDGLAVSAHSAQEDEFALLTLGVRSAYRAFLMPNRIEELWETLDQGYWLEEASWWKVWVSFLRGVLYTLPEARQPLVLKSPNHTYRLRAILERFPRARLVWMLRDPVELFHSNIRMWRSMFAHYGMVRPNDGKLEDFIARAIANAAQTLQWCGSSLSNSRMVMASLDALRADPAAVVGTVCERLGLNVQFSPGGLQREIRATTAPPAADDLSGLSRQAQDSIAQLRLAYQSAAGRFGLGT
jgi:omega-hydroxy-beta-dihydromenaquinone-9 sulfotransferase